MQVIGIVAEYNPFHHGHRYQIAAVRQRYPAAHVVAVMSGSFTQRGAPSILDKWTRAAHAVEGGADLILVSPCSHISVSSHILHLAWRRRSSSRLLRLQQ